ncbi:MAG: 6-carboxytetrahydropterin synthase [Planctomycetia bacterium]|nr:6-carboxytetrahydropterin synthase [Planctomycetia bacterium]
MEKTFHIRLDAATQTFSPAHFITFDSSQCEPIHGHDFHVALELEQSLSPAGYVVDFIPLNETLMEILKKLDHKTLIQGENPNIRFTMEEKEPEDAPDMVDWMSRVGGWLSSVNQYENGTEKQLTPDDYFQKMALMATDGMNLDEETPEKCVLESDSGKCEISNGMSPMSVELEVRYGSRRWVFPMEDCVILPIFNTTAELLAEYIAEQLAQCELLSAHRWTRLTVEVEEADGMKGTFTLKAE